mmetsp:Transcript_16428/g.46887  ORF Transcript_16428/g.46887 Transcript_16428/m.46887 type:complete len:257 (-) Transcript_16428:237-1007(-)
MALLSRERSSSRPSKLGRQASATGRSSCSAPSPSAGSSFFNCFWMASKPCALARPAPPQCCRIHFSMAARTAQHLASESEPSKRPVRSLAAECWACRPWSACWAASALSSSDVRSFAPRAATLRCVRFSRLSRSACSSTSKFLRNSSSCCSPLARICCTRSPSLAALESSSRCFTALHFTVLEEAFATLASSVLRACATRPCSVRTERPATSSSFSLSCRPFTLPVICSRNFGLGFLSRRTDSRLSFSTCVKMEIS